MINIKEDNIFTCKECGWPFPNQLVDLLLEKDESIYCEKCGIENKKTDFGKTQISQIPQKIRQKTVVNEDQQEKLELEAKEETKNLRTLLSIAKKKSVEYKKKLRSKFKDLMD